MIIICGINDENGNPVQLTEERKIKFMESLRVNKDDKILFSSVDIIPKNMGDIFLASKNK